MPVAMSKEQFDVIDDMLRDSEVMEKLSADQLLTLSGQIDQYHASVNERNARLRAEGLNDDQIERVNAAGKDVTPNQGKQPVPGLEGAEVETIKINALVTGAQNAVLGISDLAKDLEVGLGLTDEQDRAAWKAKIADDRTKLRINEMEKFGQLAPAGWQLAGEIAPWLFTIPASAETFGVLLAKRAMQGGIMGASFVQGADKTLVDRAFSATFGSGFGIASAIPSVVSGVRKGMARAFTRNFNNASAKQADRVQENVRRMTGDESFQFSIGQVTGGRKAVAIEQRAAGDETKAAQNANLNILSRFFFRRSKEMSDEGLSPGQISVQLRNTLEEIHTSTSKTASAEWRASHSALLEEFGDDIVIRGDDFLAKIDKMMVEAEDILTNPGGRGVKGLRKYRAEVDVEVNPIAPQFNEATNMWQLRDRKAQLWLPEKSPDRAAVQAVADQQNAAFGGLDSDTTLRIMKGLNNLIGGKSTISAKSTPGSNREVGRALMGNFTDSLESTAQNPQAVEAINGMRNAYKESMAYLQAIDDTVVARIFGQKKLPQDPGKALDRVLKQEPEDLANTATMLERHNPVLLEELRATHMARIHGGALNGKAPAVDTEVALDKFLTRLEGSMQGTGMAGKGLHRPEVQQEILTAAKALRTVKNRYFTGVSPDGGVGIDDIAINVVSRSPEFMARFVTRVVTTGKGLEAGMLDQSFRRAMATLAEAPIGSEPLKAAMVYLTVWTNKAKVNAEAEEASNARDRRQEILKEDSNAFKRGD